MLDLFYDFYNNYLINSELEGASNFALLLSYISIGLIFYVLIRFVIWLFEMVNPNLWKIRK